MSGTPSDRPGATVLTTGWKAPTGLCDCCGVLPATCWFGDTSVALCSGQRCWDSNAQKWADENTDGDPWTETN